MPAPRCPRQVNSPTMVFGQAILPKKMDKGYSNKEETIKEKGHQGYLLTEDFNPEDDGDDNLVASADPPR